MEGANPCHPDRVLPRARVVFVGLRPLVSQKPLDGNRLQRSFFPAADMELAGKTVALLPMTFAVAPRLGKKNPNALSLVVFFSILFVLLPASSPCGLGYGISPLLQHLCPGTRLPTPSFGSKKQEGKLESASQACGQPQHRRLCPVLQHTWRKIIIKSPILFLAGYKRFLPLQLNLKVSF